MESRSAVLGSQSETHWNYGKIGHENGLKFGPSLKRSILMKIIRKFNHKFIDVSHVKIGIQLLNLWNLRVQLWAPILKATGNTEKSNMRIG